MNTPDHAAYVAEAFDSYKPEFKDLENEFLLLGLAAAALAEDRLSPEQVAALERHRFVAIAEGPPFRERLLRLYEDAGRFDQLEAYARPGEWGAELPWPEHFEIIERFAAAGRGTRVLRIWRHFLGKIGGEYWYWVRERDASLVREAKGKPAPPGALDAVQNSERAADHKMILLEALHLSEQAFVTFGSDRDRAWHRRQAREVTAEQRDLRTDPPDRSPMSEELFWTIVSGDGGTTDARMDTLPDRLAAYGPKAIKTFGQMVADKRASAFRSDLWALAYLLMRGASDDAFDAFRNWLILQGRETYEATLADPDGFDVGGLAETPMAEGLPELVEQAHELRSGESMPRLKQRKVKIDGIDEDAFATMLPKVAAATGQAK